MASNGPDFALRGRLDHRLAGGGRPAGTSVRPVRTAPSGAPAEAPRRGGQLVTTVRAEPRSFNRIAVRTQSADLLSVLTQARLVRVNRATFELEPWLAERWDSSPDGLTHTLYLRDGLKWSDGTPLTAEDVAFSFQAATDEKVSALASGLIAGGKPITATVVDARTVRVSFAGPSGPGSADAGRAAHPAAAQAGGGLRGGQVRRGVVDADAAGRRRGAGAVRVRVLRAWPARGARPQPALLAQGARRHAAAVSGPHRRWKWCRTRTPSCCDCSPARAICRRTRFDRKTTCRCAVRRSRAR